MTGRIQFILPAHVLSPIIYVVTITLTFVWTVNVLICLFFVFDIPFISWSRHRASLCWLFRRFKLLERVLFNFLHATEHSGINRLIAVGFSFESRRASMGGGGGRVVGGQGFKTGKDWDEATVLACTWRKTFLAQTSKSPNFFCV